MEELFFIAAHSFFGGIAISCFISSVAEGKSFDALLNAILFIINALIVALYLI